MNPNVAPKGRSFKGAIAYIIHDPDQADTDERVLFIHTVNLRTNDPEKAAKVMAFTALHAAELKAQAGVKATGRKTTDPVLHMSLSWIPGERPAKAEMIEAGKAALKVLGYEDHEAVFAAHGDKDHLHLHLVVSRINPITGKTHNPKNDREILQGWGHEYDKARGMEHHSPMRAAKYEKDPAKKKEYQELAEAMKAKNGDQDLSKPRPQWEAENKATHPKSQKYKDIKAFYAERVKTLSAASRALADRHRTEWSALKEQHSTERAALKQRAMPAKGLTGQFKMAARPKPTGSRKNAPDKMVALKASQRSMLRQKEADLRTLHAPEIEAFSERQRLARRDYARQKRVLKHSSARDLGLAIITPVGHQTKAHRGHLSARFNQETVQAVDPQAFKKAQQQEKAAFLARLASEDRPQLERLRAKQADQIATLRNELKAVEKVANPHSHAQQRQERTALGMAQKDKYAVLRARQKQERLDLQGQWAALNKDRTAAWDGYRAHRAGQMATRDAQAARDQSKSLSDSYQRSVEGKRPWPSGRDYGGGQITGGGGKRSPG